ncbi:general transcription factor II-I repeat domain-containing protein 2A-like [Panulirus ornatus]|uniref:general transcription factor II-I repeat domain-containing protein 2A-like n=1 Tax=Panulirus ornatus TaxID=150431 RepID=UPI003A88F844
MTTNRKRKILEEHRTFNMKWEQRFLFIENNGKPQCLVCSQVLAVSKGYNVSRHYNTLHKAEYDQYVGESRFILLKDLKSRFKKHKSLFTITSAVQTARLAASYQVCLELVKSKNSFKDGEIVKRCAVRMARAFGDEEMAKKFESVMLSPQTVARRVSEMNEAVSSKLKSVVENCKFFSLALDDSSDVSNINQLLIFIRTIDEDFSVHEELLKMHPLGSSTKGSDIVTAVVSVVNEFGGFHKCSCIVTNGSDEMMGIKAGLVGLLKKNGVDCVILHCIMHHEVLHRRYKMSDVMASVISIVHILRGISKTDRNKKLISFLEKLNAEFSDMLPNSNVRWASAARCLQHFFSLRKEILYFFQNENCGILSHYREQLHDERFLRSLAFLTDLTMYLNMLNVNLQCKQQNVSQLLQHTEAFRKKLKLFSACLKKNDVTHFPCCRELLAEDSTADFSSFIEVTENVSAEFDKRFTDVKSLKTSLALFNNPMESDIEHQPADLQLELCDLQTNFFFQTKKNEVHDQFWKLVCRDRFPNLRDFGLKMCSMFGGTYICENTFSMIKHMKAKTCNRIEKNTLDACLRLATTSISVNFETLVQVQPLAKNLRKEDEELVVDEIAATTDDGEGRGWLDYHMTSNEGAFIKDEQPDPDVVVKEEYIESF